MCECSCTQTLWASCLHFSRVCLEAGLPGGSTGAKVPVRNASSITGHLPQHPSCHFMILVLLGSEQHHLVSSFNLCSTGCNFDHFHQVSRLFLGRRGCLALFLPLPFSPTSLSLLSLFIPPPSVPSCLLAGDKPMHSGLRK